jgi:hypothetical protein
MKWLVLGMVAGVAAWFEYDYQRSRRARSLRAGRLATVLPVPESAHVECAGDMPSISPGSENDKKLNTVA